MRYVSNLKPPPIDIESFYLDANGLSEIMCYPRPDTMGHDAPSSRRFDPKCGFLTHDEAAILYHVGRSCVGEWVDIGSRLLWSTFHLRAGIDGDTSERNHVYAVDPQYRDEAFKATALDLVKRARLDSAMRTGSPHSIFDGPVFAETSDEFFGRSLENNPILKDVEWVKLLALSGVMVDGNHDSPFPLVDAQNAARALDRDRGVVVFHDVLGQPIRDGVLWLLENGFRGRLYYTPRMMAVCWRGDVELPEHSPDPAIDWDKVRFTIWDNGGDRMLRAGILDTKGRRG